MVYVPKNPERYCRQRICYPYKGNYREKMSETFSRSLKYLVTEIFSISIILILLFNVIVISYTQSF